MMDLSFRNGPKSRTFHRLKVMFPIAVACLSAAVFGTSSQAGEPSPAICAVVLHRGAGYMMLSERINWRKGADTRKLNGAFHDIFQVKFRELTFKAIAAPKAVEEAWKRPYSMDEVRIVGGQCVKTFNDHRKAGKITEQDTAAPLQEANEWVRGEAAKFIQ